MRRLAYLILIFAITALANPAFADDGPDAPSDLKSPQATDETHPIYSADGRWIGGLVIGCAGLFLAAMVIGPVVRSNEPEVVPEAISHVEDPAADRH